MFEKISVQDAVRKAIATEKHAMHFYALGADLMQDPDARRVFTLLAGEERTHAGHFYKVYTGQDIPVLDDYLNAPPDGEAEWLASLSKTIDAGFTVQKALELALSKEQHLEQTLWTTAEKIPDSAVREVFELNARETHNHYLLIEAEYARLMKMVDESDMDTFVRE